MEQKNSLILDKEFLDYCKLNNIEDIEGLARKVFKQGFDFLKYDYFQPLVKTQAQADKFMNELKMVTDSMSDQKSNYSPPSARVVGMSKPITPKSQTIYGE
jgi:hypothetical protein